MTDFDIFLSQQRGKLYESLVDTVKRTDPPDVAMREGESQICMFSNVSKVMPDGNDLKIHMAIRGSVRSLEDTITEALRVSNDEILFAFGRAVVNVAIQRGYASPVPFIPPTSKN